MKGFVEDIEELTEDNKDFRRVLYTGKYLQPAILANGVRIMVPPYLTVGTRVVVMTADGTYVERAKD